MRNGFRILIGTLACAALSACTVHEQEAPPLQGPSEMALRMNMQIVPDAIYQDGGSQSVLTVEAAGADGRPVVGLAMRFDMSVDGFVQDFGTLSSRTAVTGSDGRARVTYTAPRAPAESSGGGTVVTFLVTPIGNDYRGEVARQVDLRLIPPGVILPPNGAPTAAFTMSPSPATAFSTVTFDASGTMDEGVPCASRCTYSWTFGDGGSGSGVSTTHTYRDAGSFTVTLRVVDDRGQSASLSQTLTVAAGAPPTSSFVYSPNPPAVSQDIFFTGEASRAAPGRTLVGYDWNFGSGRNASGVTAVKRYDTPATYVVTLTVTDDAGQQGTSSQSVIVGGQGTGIVPSLTSSPTSPSAGSTVVFDASGTRGPSPIVEYRFSFGDGTADVVGTSPTTTHLFSAPGTYVVRLTVRDSAGRTATTTINVSVTP
jgi:PKD repeat protein